MGNFHYLAMCQMHKLTKFKNDTLWNHLLPTELLQLTCGNTNSSNFTKRSVPVSLCKNEFGKQNHLIHVAGQWFLNCVPQSLWGRVQRTALEVALGVGRQKKNEHTGWCQVSPTHPFLPGKLYVRVLCNNSFEAKTNERKQNQTPNEQTLLGDFSFLNL